jgi:hypothetical protein
MAAAQPTSATPGTIGLDRRAKQNAVAGAAKTKTKMPTPRHRLGRNDASNADIASGRTPNAIEKCTVVSVANGSGKPAKCRSYRDHTHAAAATNGPVAANIPKSRSESAV